MDDIAKDMADSTKPYMYITQALHELCTNHFFDVHHTLIFRLNRDMKELIGFIEDEVEQR